MATRSNFVAEARGWYGVKWQHQGRTRLGVDCLGLPDLCALALGLVAALAPANYPRRPNGALLPGLRAHPALAEIAPPAHAPGNLLVFSALGEPHHVGIAATRHGAPSVIHAYAIGRMVREDLLPEIPAALGVVTHAFVFHALDDA